MVTQNRQNARSQNARGNIVQAALTVFALKGYAAASMEDVCLAAGCSKGGLYHHFPTKAAVMRGVVRRLGELGALLPPFPSVEGASALPAASLARLLIDVWAEAARDPDLRQVLREGYHDPRPAGLEQPGGVTEILRMGSVIGLLTRPDELDTDGAARRLGIERAA